MRANVIQGCFPHGLPRTGVARGTPRAVQLSPGQPPLPQRGGFPLAAPVLQRMESLFGTPLDAVRIHVGPHVAALGAHALTQGDDIHFAPGHYDPSSARGSQLLVEQLAHVVQQRSGRVHNPFGSGTAIVQDPALDREARAFAVAQPYFSFRGSRLGANNQRVKDARARIQDQGTLGRFNRAFSDARNHGTPASWLRSNVRSAPRAPAVKRKRERDEAPPSKRRKQENKPALVDAIVAYLTDSEPDNKCNYTIAVMKNGNLMIAKVNGLTSGDGVIDGLKEILQEYRFSKSVYLAKKFGGGGSSSNHAEMCILAAVGRARRNTINYMICTCPSCPFCAETLQHYGVTNRSPSGATSRQTGWVHPFERYYFGSVYPGTEARQVAALSAFHARGTVPALGGTGPTAPREGQYETLDF